MSAPNETPTGAGPGTPDGARHQAAARRRDGFRPDIQGLRAIAVGSVVLYHAGLSKVSGGYVGVDVFFVISGFLITGHLLREILSTGRLSFGVFYARRARRILPAAFAVNILTLIAATMLMPPTELKSTVHDAIATALYAPNMIFANRATDYLAQSGQPSLFQHFWSLGVEEQFYLVWPLLLVATFALVRRRRFWLGVAVGGVALVSFVACVRLTTTNQPWAFFTLPTRAWEFAAGGLTALIIASGRRLPRVPAALAVWAGLAGLGIAIFGFTDATRFPGTAAALPVLATALVILGGAGIRSGTPSGRGRRPPYRRPAGGSASRRWPSSARSPTRSTWCTGRSSRLPGTPTVKVNRCRCRPGWCSWLFVFRLLTCSTGSWRTRCGAAGGSRRCGRRVPCLALFPAHWSWWSAPSAPASRPRARR